MERLRVRTKAPGLERKPDTLRDAEKRTLAVRAIELSCIAAGRAAILRIDHKCSSTVFERADIRQEKSDNGARAAYIPL
jgi:hypothetical protein